MKEKQLTKNKKEKSQKSQRVQDILATFDEQKFKRIMTKNYLQNNALDLKEPNLRMPSKNAYAKEIEENTMRNLKMDIDEDENNEAWKLAWSYRDKTH